MNEIIEALPENLNADVTGKEEFEVAILELDDQWSYVGKKKKPTWLWLVIYSDARQVLAMHVRKRNRQSTETLLAKLPENLKKAVFYTDKFSIYYEVLPWAQHRSVGKESGKTSYIERFNNTLRQRCSRLVRKTLSFSKKIENDIGMIKYFIYDYNRQKPLHV